MTIIMSGICYPRFQAFSPNDGEMALDELLTIFDSKAKEYLTRSYAPIGGVAGFSIEYIDKIKM